MAYSDNFHNNLKIFVFLGIFLGIIVMYWVLYFAIKYCICCQEKSKINLLETATHGLLSTSSSTQQKVRS